MGIDGSLRHPYFRDLTRQLRVPSTPATFAKVAAAAARAHVVYVGDFHADPACQTYTADLLEAMARRVPSLALGIEFLFTRQQKLLDRRQAGLLDDATFLRRVHYREEWGYPWEGFRALLDRARHLSIPAIALDTPPRGGFDGLARRDEHAARRIASILATDPRLHLLVLFGESHVSRGHIPRRVRLRLARSGLERRAVTVFQDPDGLYWSFASRGKRLPEAVRIDPETFAVFHTSPLAKYEAYRQVIERWHGDVPPDEEVDLTPAVHHLITVLLGWLGIRAERCRVRHEGGWTEDLVDAFPEVYTGPDAVDLLVPILEEYGRTPQEVSEARELLAERGALYDSRSNALFLVRYLPGRAAGEGARFLRAALCGRLYDPPEEAVADVLARTYGAAYNEALADLGALLVDPASDFLALADARSRPTTGTVARGLKTAVETAERAQWIEAHRHFEATGHLDLPRSLLEGMRRSRSTRRAMARDLGHRLGRVLFERVQQGELDQRDLRSLFSRPLPRRRAQRLVLSLLREGNR